MSESTSHGKRHQYLVLGRSTACAQSNAQFSIKKTCEWPWHQRDAELKSACTFPQSVRQQSKFKCHETWITDHAVNRDAHARCPRYSFGPPTYDMVPRRATGYPSTERGALVKSITPHSFRAVRTGKRSGEKRHSTTDNQNIRQVDVKECDGAVHARRISTTITTE